MVMPRYSAKRDDNEIELASTYLKLGCSVDRISEKGIPDLLIGFKGLTSLAEVKTKNGKPTKAQKQFRESFKGHHKEVRTIDDVLQHVNELIAMSLNLNRG